MPGTAILPRPATVSGKREKKRANRAPRDPAIAAARSQISRGRKAGDERMVAEGKAALERAWLDYWKRRWLEVTGEEIGDERAALLHEFVAVERR